MKLFIMQYWNAELQMSARIIAVGETLVVEMLAKAERGS